MDGLIQVVAQAQQRQPQPGELRIEDLPTIGIAFAVVVAFFIGREALVSRRLRRPRRAAEPRLATPARAETPPERPASAPHPPERPPAPETIALAAQPGEAEQTRARVAALPARVDWPLADARLDRLPVLYDGEHWHALDATASRHGVICGASRSGKGNLLQLLALAVLAQGPERAAVWALDPKGGLDYAALLPLAHAQVYADVADGPSPFDGDLSAGYRAALRELSRRNRLLLAAGARNHHEYRMRTGLPLPILALICDEVAELSGPQQRALATLARMAAAAGIVVWAATQYPTVESLPSQVQANALDRLVFQFPSPRYTAVALGLAPGERPVYTPSAIGQRGVAILRQDGRDVCVGRVPLLDDRERTRVVQSLASQYPRAGREARPAAPAALPALGGAAGPSGAGLKSAAAHGGAPRPATNGAGPRAPAGSGGARSGDAPEQSAPPAALGGAGDADARRPETPPAPVPLDEAARWPERERDELVRGLAAQGLSQREIRRRLSERGMAIAQERLSALCQEGRALREQSVKD
jgi:hypothetical protein